MADLSFLKDDTTIGVLDRAVEAERAKQPPRNYLGMSAIGDPCERRLWFEYHTDYVPTFPAIVLRKFEVGDWIEARVVRDLVACGIEVIDTQREYEEFDGKFKGHSDGVIAGLPESKKTHILEVKSANDKNFKLFKKNGIREHPDYGEKYYAQAQCYMNYDGLERCLFIIENKNTSERYQERIKFDHSEFERIREKAQRILEATAPPHGISERPDWYACKFCGLNNEDWCRRTWPGEAPF